MEQNKKIIISVKVGTIKPENFSNYQAYDSIELYDLYELLLKKHSTVFDNEEFQQYLKGLTYINQLENVMPVIPADINYIEVFNNDNFQKWITEHKKDFISSLIGTNDVCLIRKHKKTEIYVVPVLNEDFIAENLEYTEKLIKALKKKDDDLWLLLHDKDLYKGEKGYHRADKSEFENKPVIKNCQELMTLIENNKVFTFIHQDSDRFFPEVIKKLDELSLVNIIEELERHKRVDFAKEVAKKIKKEDMACVLENASETYDFSKQFLEL